MALAGIIRPALSGNHRSTLTSANVAAPPTPLAISLLHQYRCATGTDQGYLRCNTSGTLDSIPGHFLSHPLQDVGEQFGSRTSPLRSVF